MTRGNIRFEDVRFDYGGGRQVINGFNLDIKPGEKIGLIGPRAPVNRRW